MVNSEALSRLMLEPADLPGAQALSDAAGWNQTADDWALFIGRGQTLCWRSESGELVATGAALPYGDRQGWISMVLVDAKWRHQGLATGLLGDAVDFLRARGATPVLDATPAGEPVYRRLGFAAGLAFERWQAGLGPHSAPATDPGRLLRAAGPADLDLIAALDEQASRVSRRFLLESFLSRPASRAWITRDGSGFVIVRAGQRARQVGPLVARNEEQARVLLETALAGEAAAVFLDLPKRWAALTGALQRQGFTRQRSFTRMALGAAQALHGSPQLFVLAGPEFG